MKVFLLSTAVAVLLALFASYVLNSRYQYTAYEAYTDAGVRLGDPGDNLVDWQ